MPYQLGLVTAIGPALAQANLEIIEVGVLDGCPDFSFVPASPHTRPAQLIVFASPTRKPALRLRDVLDSQIELLDDADDALAYDRPVPETGLTWGHLKTWWSDRRQIPFADGKRDLWRRLNASIPVDSAASTKALRRLPEGVRAQRQNSGAPAGGMSPLGSPSQGPA